MVIPFNGMWIETRAVEYLRLLLPLRFQSPLLQLGWGTEGRRTRPRVVVDKKINRHVAQWLERRVHIAEVSGSTPAMPN